ncbi:hypothetical protein D4764_0131990 [Takifugu flavidus]|uniref:DUF6729 domain-containing protein n=2 Tax=Takifugu flavidus TaxID=433684 RepID=A0A5C6MHJ1_9TELE|nr:hypothetical protein D4764_0131990 [Takifugu flavidus]
MQKQFTFFPGKLWVVFRKGPLGFLLQEPSDEAKRVSSTPQDKSAAMREDLVRQNALAVIRQRGGDPSDKMENDVGYTVYLIKNVQSEEAAGLCMADSHSQDSLQSFVSYALSFQEIQALLTYEAGRGDGVTASSEDDQLAGVPGTRMSRLQQNLLKRQQPTTSSTPAEHPMKAPAEPLAMEEDVEMEREMLSIHNSDLQVQSYAMPVAAAALPRVPPGAKTGPDSCTAQTSDGRVPPLTDSTQDQKSVPIAPVPMPVPDHDMSKWICSQHQKLWMRTELQQLGLWPGSRPVHNPGNAISLWRLPPQPELLDMVAELPSPNFFQLHPFFIWKPESHIMVRLRNNDILPCLHSCPRPQVVSAGVGRPPVIVSVRGQYLIFSSRLCCKACRRNWSADNPPWVEKLPVRFTNLLPAFLTYKKAVCKSVMDELRRSGKSPTDMANQVNELMHLKYERAHLAYLHAVQNVREAEAGAYGQRTIGQDVRMEDRPRAFGPYEDQEGWGGVSVSGFYLTDCLLDEFKRQQPSLTKLLQGTLGQVFRSDHTRKMARKQGMAQRYSHAGVEKAGYHWMDSDPELSEGIMYRDGGTLQLNHVAGEGAKVPVWIPVRGTSQQEGYHFQQAQWVTGTQVSPELFQAQAMTGVVRWNFQRPVDMKKPGAVLPAVFDPASMWELNSASMAVTGQDKCPAFTSLTETLEKDDAPGATPSSSWATATAVPSLPPAPPVSFHLSAAGRVKEIPAEDDQDPERSVGGSTIIGFFRAAYVSGALPLPLKSSPRSARTGPMKTGGGVFVLDHTRWTLPMKDAIDSLLQYHHGDKDILRLVDPDYADMVHRSAADPNSLLRPTTRFHISRYVKHLAKLLNTSSSLNTSPEKLLETQQLWYSLTEGSNTTSVPVVTMETAVVTPPTAALPTPLTQDSIEKIVQGILEMEQQQQRPEQKMRQTKPCLACGQPKSPYGTGCSSIHFFYQQGPVRYFYCSRKVHQTYAAEGLSDPRMPFEQFAASEFFQRELEATKKRVEDKAQRQIGCV